MNSADRSHLRLRVPLLSVRCILASRALFIVNVPLQSEPLATFSTEVLKLERNSIVGTIPASVVELSNLKEVHLQGNLMTGSIPAEIINLTNLGKLQ